MKNIYSTRCLERKIVTSWQAGVAWRGVAAGAVPVPSALTRTSSLCSALPPAERQVAEYVLRNPEKVPFLSVSELARVSNVSVASVSRLAEKAGYGSFQKFKIDIAQQTIAGVDDIYQAITPGDSDADVIKKVFRGNIKSLGDTLKLVGSTHLVKASKVISRAEWLLFLGIGSSGNISRDAALRFSHLGLHADACIDTYEMLVQVTQSEATSVVVGLSHSGRSRSTVEGLGIARKNGATTIAFSNYPQSPLSTVSDIFLCTAFPETEVRTAALSSRLSQMCLVDALYVLVARRMERSKCVRQLDKLVEEALRSQQKK